MLVHVLDLGSIVQSSISCFVSGFLGVSLLRLKESSSPSPSPSLPSQIYVTDLDHVLAIILCNLLSTHRDSLFSCIAVTFILIVAACYSS